VVTEEQTAVLDNFASRPDNPTKPNSSSSSQKPNSSSSSQKPSSPSLSPEQEQAAEQYKKEFCEYVRSAPYFLGVEPEFLDLFPIEENFDFWYHVIIEGNYKQIDYRYFKSVLYNEIVRLNQNEAVDCKAHTF
jgi:hypothetical protein